jgi:hypothetical protein
VSDGQISDDELLYRCIRPGTSWFQPPDRISSGNFKPRDGDSGISVYRARIVDATGVLSRLHAPAGSRIAQATAGQIRATQNGKGEPLNLDVVPANDEDNPGHAEIRGPVPGKISNSAANALRNLFKLVELPPGQL